VVPCCGLRKEWYGGEGCGRHSLWLVLLKSSKDQFLVVDPPEQSVSPCVRYGMTYLLISDTSGSSRARRMVRELCGYMMNQHGARGA
jgi:hypothetical protein